MSKQLILHVGLNKTGTTSIQQTCFDNRQALRRAGLVYPKYSFEGERAANHSPLLQRMFWRESGRAGPLGRFLPGREEIALQHRADLRSRMAGFLERQTTDVLMVAEGVCEFDPSELQDLRDWFEEQGWTVRVICSVRHLSTWVHSMVAQRVAGLRRMTIPAVIDMFVEGGMVRPRIESIQEVFPDAEFRSFE